MKYCLIDKEGHIGYSTSKYLDMFNVTSMCFTKIFDDKKTALAHMKCITNPNYKFEVMTVKEALPFMLDYYFKKIEDESGKENSNRIYIHNLTRDIRNALERMGGTT